MALLGVVGMAGSGKSHLVSTYVQDGWKAFDDIFAGDGASKIMEARQRIANGERVIISDVEFCHAHKRTDIERRLGSPIEWRYYANDPWQCAKNCLYRHMYVKHHELEFQLRKIRELTKIYDPPATAMAIIDCEQLIRGQAFRT